MSPGNHRHRTLAETAWETAPTPWPAPPVVGEAHLWRIPLAGATPPLPEHEQLLAPEEFTRAGRFHYSKDRSAFITARASLRCLLGHYLRRKPEAISFGYGTHGKPFLAGPEPGGLSFNLSHAGGHALIGFTTCRSIGVDLEAEDPSINVERLAERFFSPHEYREVLALPAAERVPAFFRTWTRKEAFLKAHGAGLGLPLDQFSVTIDLNKPVRLERIDWAPEQTDDWAMAGFMVAEGLPGAVVVEGELTTLRFYELG